MLGGMYMKNYKEIYNELTKQIAELKTKRTDISRQLEEVTLKYNDIKSKNNRKLSAINYKIDSYRDQLNVFNEISCCVALNLCVAIVILSPSLNINVALEIVIAILSLFTCGSLYMVVLKSYFHKKRKKLFDERHNLMNKYQPEMSATKNKVDSLSKEKEDLDNIILGREQELHLLLEECSKLYMNLSEDKVEYKDDTIEENKPYVRRKKLNNRQMLINGIELGDEN